MSAIRFGDRSIHRSFTSILRRTRGNVQDIFMAALRVLMSRGSRQIVRQLPDSSFHEQFPVRETSRPVPEVFVPCCKYRAKLSASPGFAPGPPVSETGSDAGNHTIRKITPA